MMGWMVGERDTRNEALLCCAQAPHAAAECARHRERLFVDSERGVSQAWVRFRCNINCKDDPDNCIRHPFPLLAARARTRAKVRTHARARARARARLRLLSHQRRHLPLQIGSAASERLFMEMADVLVRDGWKDLGCVE